jgi:hypothetical protein
MYISRSRALNSTTIPQPVNPRRRPAVAQALSARAGEQSPCAPAQCRRLDLCAQQAATIAGAPPWPLLSYALPLLQDLATDDGSLARLRPCSRTMNGGTNGVASWPSSGALQTALVQVPAWSCGPWSRSADDPAPAQLMCALSWTYPWRSQHFLEL